MKDQKRLLITGAAGFIGSHFVREALKAGYQVTLLDSLTYAGQFSHIQNLLEEGVCDWVHGDITDVELIERLFKQFVWRGVVHFAAETHVDQSITGPGLFIQTNVAGTLNLLEGVRRHWQSYDLAVDGAGFRFLHVSTDEVFGALGPTGFFNEQSPYAPHSPYAASKASSDHLVRAWHHTYGIPAVITHCSNNYGIRQYPEKLIPFMIHQALKEAPLPVYGKGNQVRDWIHVEDHVRGVLLAFEKGKNGESYCLGGHTELTNLEIVSMICDCLDEWHPRKDGKPHRVGIQFVTDRAGHDFRYAIDDSKAVRELGFERKQLNFREGLRETIRWYLDQKQKA